MPRSLRAAATAASSTTSSSPTSPIRSSPPIGLASSAATLARYGESDLLYYRADEPPPLVDRQRAAWDPLLGWAQTRYDVVVANILSSPLKLMAPMLAGRVKPGGALVLSGVLARQAQEVIDAYAPYLALSVWAEREGWVALAGVATADGGR